MKSMLCYVMLKIILLQIKLFTAIPGEIIGALAVLTGEPSFFTIKAKTELKVVVISKNDFYS